MERLLVLLSLYLLFDGSCQPPSPIDYTDVNKLGILTVPSLNQSSSSNSRHSHFPYGVASGDPLSDAVIIWSMLDSTIAHNDSSAVWEISLYPTFTQILQRDSITTNRSRGYSLKADVKNLQPNTIYYYRFGQAENWSPIGRTRTAPSPSADIPVNLAIVSCNALEWGYFNAFENIAQLPDLNAVVHLGDYIYEYASGNYGDTTLGRIHEPLHEVITQADYHQRYAQYRQDPQLQAAHAVHPFICVWDDHEVANNNHTEGAENHNAAIEGDYLSRMTAAKQVYYNWMPIREQTHGAIYRSFSFGRQADLHMLDERLAGRDAPPKSFDTQELLDTSRSMLGDHQFDWLCNQLRNGKGRWQLLGNQVMFAKLDLSNILPQYAVNLDAWDGYAYEQGRLKDSLAAYQNKNTLFLTGDTHCSWFFNINDSQGDRLAYELATPSVSSANYDEFIQSWDTMMVAQYRLYRDNEHLTYTNLKDHGYLHLNLSYNRAKAQFHFSKSIRFRTKREKNLKTFIIDYEQPNHLAS